MNSVILRRRINRADHKSWYGTSESEVIT